MLNRLKNKKFFILFLFLLNIPNCVFAANNLPKGCAKWPYSKVIAKSNPYLPSIRLELENKVVSEELVIAVITAESCFQPEALSKAGALGLMQLMPATAKRFGVTNRLQAKENIKGGIGYLNFLMHKFKKLEHVIAGYNAGEGAVMKYDGVPPYRETQQYLVNVLHVYNKLISQNKKKMKPKSESKTSQNLLSSTIPVELVNTPPVSSSNGFVKWKVSPMKAAINGFK
ncbi:lytic transglycosylase domain-containing protein [Leucothrix sargassi]|nr:lytic transglycosylase domain-containing protein [Leucothrix sargassi]